MAKYLELISENIQPSFCLFASPMNVQNEATEEKVVEKVSNPRVLIGQDKYGGNDKEHEHADGGGKAFQAKSKESNGG
jgi:hypothetical protein